MITMAVVKKLSSYKRFNARYGKKVKERFAKIEEQYKKYQECPYCHYKKVKRVAAGIWQCEKCGAKFTAGAYTIKTKNQPIK